MFLLILFYGIVDVRTTCAMTRRPTRAWIVNIKHMLALLVLDLEFVTAARARLLDTSDYVTCTREKLV